MKFCDISFKYGEKMPLVLNGLTLQVKAGETVALVGPSGGGKTTLAKLLIRLYGPFSGEFSGKIVGPCSGHNLSFIFFLSFLIYLLRPET